VEAERLNNWRGCKKPDLARVCILCAFSGGSTRMARCGRTGVVGGESGLGEGPGGAEREGFPALVDGTERSPLLVGFEEDAICGDPEGDSRPGAGRNRIPE
jgi:hypothetical protein